MNAFKILVEFEMDFQTGSRITVEPPHSIAAKVITASDSLVALTFFAFQIRSVAAEEGRISRLSSIRGSLSKSNSVHRWVE